MKINIFPIAQRTDGIVSTTFAHFMCQGHLEQFAVCVSGDNVIIKASDLIEETMCFDEELASQIIDFGYSCRDQPLIYEDQIFLTNLAGTIRSLQDWRRRGTNGEALGHAVLTQWYEVRRLSKARGHRFISLDDAYACFEDECATVADHDYALNCDMFDQDACFNRAKRAVTMHFVSETEYRQIDSKFVKRLKINGVTV